MIPRVLILAVTVLLALANAGCRSLVPFTQEIRDQNHLSEADLRNLQFYVSSTVTLRHEVGVSGPTVSGNHKLIVIGGKTIEELVVESYTPGICVGVGPHTLAISFQQGSSIDFSPPGFTPSGLTASGFAEPPPPLDPFPGNRPQPATPRYLFTGGYQIVVGPSNTVSFLGQVFEPVEDTARAALLVDAESLDAMAKQRKILPGLRLTPRQ